MRKIFVSCMMAGMLMVTVGITGCGTTQQDTTEATTQESVEEESEEGTGTNTESDVTEDTDISTSTDSSGITLEDVMNASESPAEDFSGGDNGEGEYSISGYDGTDEIVVIPDEIDGLPVTEIEKYAFSNNRAETVRAIRLPDLVVSIEEGGAFINNEVLEIFVAGTGLESIGENTFFGCSSLKSIVLNEGLVEIQDGAFRNCTELSELTIPSTVETIGNLAIFGVSDDFVIYGTTGSVAESYAEENNITFVEN